MLLVAAALLSAITTMHFAIHGAEVKVPALKGMTVAEARSQAAGMGLNLDVDNRYYSADVAAGHILSQSPAPGTVVRREWHVAWRRALARKRWMCPTPSAPRAGVARIAPAPRRTRSGRHCANFPTARVAEGTVIAQDPPAHAQGIAQPSVNILVAVAGQRGAGRLCDARSHRYPHRHRAGNAAKIGIKVDTPPTCRRACAAGQRRQAPPKPLVRPRLGHRATAQAGARVDLTT